MAYEFSQEHDKTILSVSTLAIILAGLVTLGGVTSAVDTLIDTRVGVKLPQVIMIVQSIIQIVTGLLFIPAALSFRRVATTKGSDIKEMIKGLGDMGQAFYIIVYMIVVSIILDVVLIFI